MTNHSLMTVNRFFICSNDSFAPGKLKPWCVLRSPHNSYTCICVILAVMICFFNVRVNRNNWISCVVVSAVDVLCCTWGEAGVLFGCAWVSVIVNIVLINWGRYERTCSQSDITHLCFIFTDIRVTPKLKLLDSHLAFPQKNQQTADNCFFLPEGKSVSDFYWLLSSCFRRRKKS